MQLHFLTKIINRNWFSHEPGWTFHEDLRTLKDNELRKSVLLLFECIGKRVEDKQVKGIVEVLKFDKSFILDDMEINKDLILKFLICITYSEYRIDDLLLHPPDMRSQEFKEICQSIGLPQDMVRTIYSTWHSSVRQKVFGVAP